MGKKAHRGRKRHREITPETKARSLGHKPRPGQAKRERSSDPHHSGIVWDPYNRHDEGTEHDEH